MHIVPPFRNKPRCCIAVSTGDIKLPQSTRRLQSPRQPASFDIVCGDDEGPCVVGVGVMGAICVDVGVGVVGVVWVGFDGHGPQTHAGCGDDLAPDTPTPSPQCRLMEVGSNRRGVNKLLAAPLVSSRYAVSERDGKGLLSVTPASE